VEEFVPINAAGRLLVVKRFINSWLWGSPESSVPFYRSLRRRKSKAVKGKPQTMATMPATTECHLMQPNAKSITAQTEKKTSALGSFIFTSIMLYSAQC
jgi:hypothetical protein